MKKLPGFTFIEIMIAIFVFSVGILAVLQVMTSNVALVAHAQNRTTAAMFAQEGLALVFSLRDANKSKGYGRDCIPSSQVFVVQQPTQTDFCEYRMSQLAQEGQRLLLGFDPIHYMTITVAEDPDTTLYYHTGDMHYRATSGVSPSGLRRYIAFDLVLDNEAIVDPEVLLKVTSIVEYRKGADWDTIRLESFIGAW